MLCAGLIVLAGAVPAHAWTVASVPRILDPELAIDAAPGEANSLTIAVAPPAYTAAGPPGTGQQVVIRDASAPLTGVGHGCVQVDANTARCAAIQRLFRPGPNGEINYEEAPGGIAIIRANLSDGDDSFTLAPGLRVYSVIDAGAGADTIMGWTNSSADVDAGPGHDRVNLRGNSGAADKHGFTYLRLGEGDDLLNVANGWTDDDDYECGDGADTVYYDEGDQPVRGDCERRQVKLSPPASPLSVP